MKTIALDDEAYARLRAWKRSPQDSFSRVVKRVVPEAGSLGAFARFAESARKVPLASNDAMQAATEERSSVKEDPWTT